MSLTSYSYIEIVQDEKFGFNSTVIEAILKDWSVVSESVYVYHNLCSKENGSPRDPHYHLLLHFNSPQPHINTVNHIESVCKANGFNLSLPDQCYQKMRGRGHKGWCACLNYYTHRDEHADHPWKHVYPVSSIIASYDISADLEIGHDNKVKSNKKKDLKITEVKKSDVFNAVSSYGFAAIKNFDRFQIRQYMSEIQDGLDDWLDSIGRRHETRTIFISGSSAIGKDNFARYLANCLGYTGSQIYETERGEHVVDGYDVTKHRVVLFTEARDSVFKFDQFLSFTEPHRVAVNSARYHNKLVVADYIIITSSKPISSWYDNARRKLEDPWQFFRRIPYLFHLDKDRVTFYESSYNLFHHDKVYQDFPYVPCAFTNNRFSDIANKSSLPVYYDRPERSVPEFETFLYMLGFVPMTAVIGTSSVTEDCLDRRCLRDLYDVGLFQIDSID